MSVRRDSNKPLLPVSPVNPIGPEPRWAAKKVGIWTDMFELVNTVNEISTHLEYQNQNGECFDESVLRVFKKPNEVQQY